MAIARDRELRSSVNEAVRGPTTRPYETLLRTLRILRSHEPVTTEDLSDHLGTSTQVAQAFMDSLNRYSEQFAEQGEDGRWSLTPSGRSLLVLEHEESIANIHSLLESLSVD